MSESDFRDQFPNFAAGGRSARCPKGHAIPDKAVTCPECAAELAEPALRDLQRQFLRKARDHDWNYLLRVARAPQRHAILYSTHTRTFCGLDLKTRPRIEYVPYTADTLSKLCPLCRTAIASALEEDGS